MMADQCGVRLCIAGGGTGGHVMPALALADAVRERWSHVQVDFIGAERGLEATLLPERGEDVLLLEMHAVQGVSLLHKLRVLLWEMPLAVFQIRRRWKQQRPDVLVGVGGYASATGVMAALLSGVPVVLYEQNAVPGLVNRNLARFCQKVMLGFSEAAEHLPRVSCIHTGNIVRHVIHKVAWQQHTPPCLLVMGGSQGALFLNKQVPQACEVLKREGLAFRVLHVCGHYQHPRERLLKQYKDVGIEAEVMTFCEDMPDFYRQGDLMIARSGAMSVSEAMVVGMPCLFVPLPHAADQHQMLNAQSLSQHGAAICLDQSVTSVQTLADTLRQTLCQPEMLNKMNKITHQLAKKDAKACQLAVLAMWLERE